MKAMAAHTAEVGIFFYPSYRFPEFALTARAVETKDPLDFAH